MDGMSAREENPKCKFIPSAPLDGGEAFIRQAGQRHLPGNVPHSAWTSASGSWSPMLSGSGSALPPVSDEPSHVPFPERPAGDEKNQSEFSTVPAAVRVLLVEDNPPDVHVISRVLKRCEIPINLAVAATGEDALSMLQSSAEQAQPALILLDWNLPRISGAEVLAQLRGSERWRNTPVIIITSTSSPAELTEIKRLGATAYFRKPTDLDAYLELGKVILQALPRTSKG